ncbi:MAG: ABC transporter substrate-binding protein, partial [Candidatus Bathyarchaeota archaeon]|nr:ABC transporter substrate-binding protein [Candidatus Bathyarchaeota archaeon]
ERVLPDDPEAKNIAITYGDDAFRRTAGYYGYQYAVDKGFNVVMHEQYHSATTDLSPLLTKVKAAKPTIYLNAGVFTDAILLVRQMIELDLNVKMLWAGTGTVFPKFHEELDKYAEGLVTMSQWEKGVVYEHDYGPSHDEFLGAFEDRHGYTPDYHAGTGYQQGLVIQRCMELSDDPLNSESIRRLAGELDMTTFFGKFNVNPETGWQEGHKMACVQWQNGEKTVVWPMESAKELWYPIKKWSERT